MKTPNTLRRSPFSWSSRIVALLLAGACGKSTIGYKFAAPGGPAPPFAESFLMISDTQYAVPFTDYDVRYQLGKQIVGLPPEVTTKWVTSFYRHAEAHFALPLALGDILAREKKHRSFGLFGGDMAEFSCKAETDAVFNILKTQPTLPFIIAIGNHDALFHGSYDTDAVAEAGQGPWDLYSFRLWGSVCEKLGGRLTKAGFIRQIVDYYETIWGLDIHKALQLGNGAELPLGVELRGSVARSGWELTFAFRLGADDSPESHRQSYLYQRWTRREGAGDIPKATITVLDTTDYGTRLALCDVKSMPVQIGMGGAITGAQVGWLESLPAVVGSHFVASHHIPFAGTGLDRCESTFGAECLDTRLEAVLAGATFIYGHVHHPFATETLVKTSGCSKEPCTSSLVRLPSLIDNKSYVVFERGAFRAEDLTKASAIESIAPFSQTNDTCEQRYVEYVEIDRNIKCFQGKQLSPGPTACPPIANTVHDRLSEAASLCRDLSSAWKRKHAREWTALEGAACRGWRPTEHWRCILRGLAESSLEAAKLDDAGKGRLGTALLAAVQTLRGAEADSD